MNVKKCIVLSRVSTINQTLDQQTNEIKSEAKRLGYLDENIISIEDTESAIKLDEMERRGLQRLKDAINSDSSINCVVCYEVSRLSRRPKVLYSIRDFLLERKIQLVILKPYLRLLDPDGSMSQSASIMFGLFSSISESEMMIKKERMLRGKLYKMQQGFHSTGRLLFGYSKASDNRVVVDTATSKIVQDIFNRYENGESIRYIAKELFDLGLLPSKSISSSVSFVCGVLHDKQYTGVLVKNLLHPQIISTKQFQNVAAILKSKTKKRVNSVISNVYYCHGLLKSSNNHSLTVNHALCVYSYKDFDNRKNSVGINLNLIDSVAWELTKRYIKLTQNFNVEEEIYKIHDKQEILNKKIEAFQSRIIDYNSQIDRVEKRIIQGKLSEVKGDKMIHEMSILIADTEIEIDNMRYQLNQLDNQVIEYSSFLSVVDIDSHLESIISDEERYKLIHENILSIVVSNYSDNRYLKNIDVTYKNGDISSYHINSHQLCRVLQDSDNNIIEFDYLERFPSYFTRYSRK